MIQLKEALINKNNAKNARQHYPEKYLFCPNSHLYYIVTKDKEMEEKQAPAYKCAYAWYLTDKDLVKHEDWIERGDEYSLWELPTRYIGEIKLLENVLENIKYASQLIKYGFKKLNSEQLKSRIKILKNKYDNLNEALISKHNITNASSGITWVEPSSVKDLTPGRAVQFVDGWNKVRDMLILPADNPLKEYPFLSDIILCPAKTESGYFYHYTDEFVYDGELHRSIGKITKVSKELIDVSKIRDIRDVIQLFKKYRLDSTYRSLTKNDM